MEYVDTVKGIVCKSTNTNTSLSINCDIFQNNITTHTNSTHEFAPTCELREYYDVVYSKLGRNHSYKTFFVLYTLVVFISVPFVLLATFNFFLIAAVHKSHKLRRKMTNCTNNSRGDATVNQENRITIILISVCVLFFILQSPTAGYLIYYMIFDVELTYFFRGKYEIMVYKYFKNGVITLSLSFSALGNIFNFLITLNAACNFILYCVLSDKYRQTVKELFFGKKDRIQVF